MASFSRRDMLRNSLLASTTLLFSGRDQSLFQLPGMQTTDLLRLNWNENPYGPSNSVMNAIRESLQNTNLYPDAAVEALKDKLARKNNLKSNQVLLTSGSTEVLSLLGLHVGLQKGEILTPWPSFPTMIEYGKTAGASIRKVELGENETINLNRLGENISSSTTLIFICNPNNPTSTQLNTEELKSFCRSVPENILICVDEAYIEYSKAGVAGSMVGLIDELPNLVVCRTFSKAYGLAGLRIGYALAQGQNIKALQQMHPGWQISTSIASVTGASHGLDDSEHLNYCVTQNAKSREILYRAFDQWGVYAAPSGTNFLYVRSERFDPIIVSKLKTQNILITKWPDMTHHIRISMGKPEDMEVFVEKAGRFRV